MKVLMKSALGVLFSFIALLAPTHCRDTVGNQEVQVFLDPNTFNGAILNCKRNGMRLLLIRDYEEEAEVVELAKKYSFEEFWLGATDNGHESKFTTTTGEPLNYTNWLRHEPNNGGLFHKAENCVTIWLRKRNRHGWNDQKCSAEFKYFCSNQTVYS